MEDRELKGLEQALEQIWEVARRFGLDPYPVRFEVVPATVMYEIGSYALPGRYSHWTFGKAYHRMKTMYDFGLSKIYEVVINTNPSYGFLLETNSPVQNKLVMAHVLGHVDFFKHNAYFSRTNRRMVETVSAHAGRMSEYEFRYGRKTVERLLDAVLSIEEHIDPNFFIRREEQEREPGAKKPPKAPGRYDDLWDIGRPPDAAAPDAGDERPRGDRLPEKDLVYYIARNSPSLQDWQRDVLSMIHEEMEYFVPQMQTKVMNEGWACAVADTLLLTEEGFVRFDELYEAGRKIRVATGGGGELHRIKDFHKEESVPTIRIRTRRGFTIEGAEKHRVRTAEGGWKYLSEVEAGDLVGLAAGTNVWPAEKVRLNIEWGGVSATLGDVAGAAGVSYATAFRHLHGLALSRNAPALDAALATLNYRPGMAGRILLTRRTPRVPPELNEEFAWFLGYFVGDGNVTKSGIGLTTGDEDSARNLCASAESLFGLRAGLKLDESGGHSRWRVALHSRELWRVLEAAGIDLEDRAG
ncbi:MAG: SpoVR family protein, partial [Pyrinomonadaceae bacterium]